MKIYFGDANEDMFADGVFNVNDNQFYYGVEYGTNAGQMEEVFIFDGCARGIPVHIEAIPELIAALEEIKNIQSQITEANILTERVESHAQGYVTNNWSDDSFEVDYDTE
jgi:hypothetical protein